MKRMISVLPLVVAGFLFAAGVTAALAEESDGFSVWYSLNPPEEADLLVDLGPGLQRNPQENGLWVSDLSGQDMADSLQAPRGVWIRLDIEPASSGELDLQCRYPTGSVEYLLNETVEKGHRYTAWYRTEEEGEYSIWYSSGGSDSGTVSIQVSGVPETDYATTYGSSGGGSQTGVVGGTPSTSTALGSSAGGGGYLMSKSMSAPVSFEASPIGFSTGGAKDINNFRENIKAGYMPLSTDITYEGLFYDYYFDLGQTEECKKLFCPFYSYALTNDPISGDPQTYLSVGLDSGITDFERKSLNLMVVLDYSGSMGSPFDEYYYDSFGNRIVPEEEDDSGKTKMQIATESVVALLDHLNDDDRFGMVIFSDDAFVVEPLTLVEDKDMARLKDRILRITATDMTNMEAGMDRATGILSRFRYADPSQYENRIIFLTDAMPNIGETDEGDLLNTVVDNSDHRIFTTFIGIGVDFNTELVEQITKVKGANYYSVHSAGEFRRRMSDEFDYMVTPLVFDLELKLEASGYEIDKVYGSPEADEATGEIMKVSTLFPSAKEDGEVRGGLVLIKLKKTALEGREDSIRLLVSYEDRDGIEDSSEAVVRIPQATADFYDNSGIRKGVLLSRYVDLLKDWIIDERRSLDRGEPLIASVTTESGIVVPVVLGEWERQSVPLQVSEPYRDLFEEFRDYFDAEMEAIGDRSLSQELETLDSLARWEGDLRPHDTYDDA